jgi:hypothetical protein
MTVRYREKWENVHGKIPYDEYGRPYDIHHIDGDRKNNNIENLICLSIEDHYKIHLEQSKNGNMKDLAAVRFLSYRLNRKVEGLSGWTPSDETKEKIRQKLKGKKRPKDVVEKVSKALKNYKWSDETIKKRGEGIKEFYDTAPDDWKKNRNKKISEKFNISPSQITSIKQKKTYKWLWS